MSCAFPKQKGARTARPPPHVTCFNPRDKTVTNFKRGWNWVADGRAASAFFRITTAESGERPNRVRHAKSVRRWQRTERQRAKRAAERRPGKAESKNKQERNGNAEREIRTRTPSRSRRWWDSSSSFCIAAASSHVRGAAMARRPEKDDQATITQRKDENAVTRVVGIAFFFCCRRVL